LVLILQDLVAALLIGWFKNKYERWHDPPIRH